MVLNIATWLYYVRMNAIFPELLYLGPFIAPVILRLVAATAFLLYAKNVWGVSKKGKVLAVKEALFGLCLLGGFLVQIVAPLGILVILGRGIWLGADAPKRRWVESILLIGILLTLTLTGAGALAIDLPY